MSLTGSHRFLQVHPTRRCNLSCLHCYSSSGPDRREELPLAMLRGALDDAAAAGYDVASISGGEPTLYPGLAQLLEHARELGMRTTVTTNGMLLEGRRLDDLGGRADVLAISLDGVPASHDRMRGRAGAFAAMASRLEGVRAAGITFGFIFTLTQHNLDELGWVAQFALEQGASLLQIHPLEEVGRAFDRLVDRAPTLEAAFAAIATARLREVIGDRIKVQLDFADAEACATSPCPSLPKLVRWTTRSRWRRWCTAGHRTGWYRGPDPARFPAEIRLGNLNDAPIRELSERRRRKGLADFLALSRSTFDAVTAPAEAPVVNWYDKLRRRALLIG